MMRGRYDKTIWLRCNLQRVLRDYYFIKLETFPQSNFLIHDHDDESAAPHLFTSCIFYSFNCFTIHNKHRSHRWCHTVVHRAILLYFIESFEKMKVHLKSVTKQTSLCYLLDLLPDYEGLQMNTCTIKRNCFFNILF